MMMSSGESNPAGRTVRWHFDELVRAVQEPFLLATGLYAKEIIPQVVMEKVREQQMLSRPEKTAYLLGAVIDHITHKPQAFGELLAILRKPGLESAVILKVMQSMETCYTKLAGTTAMVYEGESSQVNTELATTQQENSEKALCGEKAGLLKEVQDLRREIEELKGALKTAERSEKSEKQTAVKNAELSTQVDLERPRIAKLEEQVVQMQQQYKNLKDEQEERRRRMDTALRGQQEILDVKILELMATKQQLQDTAEENAKLELKVQSLNEQVNPLMVQIEQGKTELDSKAAECVDLHQRLKTQIANGENQLEAKEEECDRLRRQLKAAEDGESKWRERIHKLNEQVSREYKSVVCELGDLTETSKQQETKIREQKDEIVRLKVQIDEHCSVIHRQQAMIAAREVEFAEKMAAMTVQIDRKTATLAQQQLILDNSFARVAELEGGKRKFEDEKEQLTAKNEELLVWIEQGTKEFTQEFKSKTAEVNNLHIRLKEAEGLQQRIKELEEQCMHVTELEQTRVTELEIQISQQLKDRRELQAKHDEKIRERTEWFKSVLDIKELERMNVEKQLKIVSCQKASMELMIVPTHFVSQAVKKAPPTCGNSSDANDSSDIDDFDNGQSVTI